jgi:hypothetical protein
VGLREWLVDDRFRWDGRQFEFLFFGLHGAIGKAMVAVIDNRTVILASKGHVFTV